MKPTQPTRTRSSPPAAHEATLDPAIRALLDHIAAELAAEYLRLMKEAAESNGAQMNAEDEEKR